MLFDWLTAAALVGAATAMGVDADVDDERLAMNPNLTVSTCSSGAQPHLLRGHGDDLSLSGSFRGDLDADAVPQLAAPYCAGYLPSEPQYCLVVTGGGGWFTLVVVDSGGVDTVLALADANGQRVACDDDSAGNLRPRVETWLAPGTYSLSIGSFGQGNAGNFQLNVFSSGG